MAANKVEYDREAKIMLKVFKNDKVMPEFTKQVAYTLTGNGPGGKSNPAAVIARHFTYSAESEKTFEPLAESTLKYKVSNKMLVETGILRTMTLKKSSLRYSLSMGRMRITQTVPKYGEYNNNGGKMNRPPARPFFSIRKGEDNTQFYASLNNQRIEVFRKFGISVSK